MDVCARKERRKERDILINYLIQIQISVGMLELKISVHVWKEEKEIILLNYLLWLQITITRLVVALDSSLDISFFFFLLILGLGLSQSLILCLQLLPLYLF